MTNTKYKFGIALKSTSLDINNPSHKYDSPIMDTTRNKTIAIAYGENAEEAIDNASELVEMANMHEELIAGLKYAVRFLNPANADVDYLNKLLKQVEE